MEQLISWEMDRQQQRALRSCNSWVAVAVVVGVVGEVGVGAALGPFVVGVSGGVLLIISKSSSGSFGMLRSLSADPVVHVYLP